MFIWRKRIETTDRLLAIQLKAKKLLKQRLDFPFKQRIDWLHSKAQKLLKQWWDFPFEKRIETRDSLTTVQNQKIVDTTVRFSMWQKIPNNGYIAYNARPKKSLKQRLDFKVEKRIEMTNRLLTMHGLKIVETRVRFSIKHKNWKKG